MAQFLKQKKQGKVQLNIAHALNLLYSVKQEDTQWTIVYEPKTLSIYFRNRSDSSICEIQLLDLNFECGSTSQVVDIKTRVHHGNQLKFDTYHKKKNQQLLRSVFDELVQLGEIEELPLDLIRKISILTCVIALINTWSK